MKQIRMKPGAPPDSELQIRLSYGRTYEPSPAGYRDEDLPSGRSMLGYLLHDKESVEEGSYMLEEAIDIGGEGLVVTFELVDSDGNVWTEEYDDGQTDPDEIQADNA